jgi:hypothetical protein
MGVGIGCSRGRLLQNAFHFVITMRVIRDPEFIDPRFIIDVESIFSRCRGGGRIPLPVI